MSHDNKLQYDTTFLCTYQMIDSDDLYRSQFLDAFKVEKWDDTIISNTTDKLYNIVKDELKEILKKIKDDSNECKYSHILLYLGGSQNYEDIFRILFTYDIFHITHKCICECVRNKKITDKSKKLLKTQLFPKIG